MKVPLLDLKAQYAGMREEIRRAMDEICDQQAFILGPCVEQFEQETAEYCGSAEAVGVSSGTDALLAALMALGIGPGDAVITSAYSFFATAGSIARTGATPVFVDIDPVSFNIDPAAVKELLEAPRKRLQGLVPKALMPVHLYGQCANMTPLQAIAAEHGLNIIEDAAQAIGAEYPATDVAVRAGAIGDMGCFSFFPSKNLGGFGDGGMITTNTPALAEHLRRLRNHGSEPKYYHSEIGGNFRLDALQAAVLRVKLKHLDQWHRRRSRNAAFYNRAFAGSPAITPTAVYADRNLNHPHIYNQYVIRLEKRDQVWEHLKKAGIGCEVYYPVPLHLQECFSALGYRPGELPESEKAANETLALPIYPELTDEMLDYVSKTVLQALQL